MTTRAMITKPSFWVSYLVTLHILNWSKSAYLGYTEQPVDGSMLYWFAYGLGGNP